MKKNFPIRNLSFSDSYLEFFFHVLYLQSSLSDFFLMDETRIDLQGFLLFPLKF